MPVVDASVYVSVANRADRHHARCLRWLESSLEQDQPLIAPGLIVVEVAASVRRLTGDQKLAERVAAELAEGELIELVPLTLERSQRAAEIAAATGVRGADAVYLALARELDETLVTLDRQQLRRGAVAASVESVP